FAFESLLFGEELRFLAKEGLLLRAETGDQLHRSENAFFKVKEGVGFRCRDGSLLGVHASYSTAFGAGIGTTPTCFPRDSLFSLRSRRIFRGSYQIGKCG